MGCKKNPMQGFFDFLIFSGDIYAKRPILGHFGVFWGKNGKKTPKNKKIQKSLHRIFFTPHMTNISKN